MQHSANEKSYQAIRQQLESGRLSPGDKLVTRNLAHEFGVSLSPIREAINRLATEGLVVHTPGAGASVKQLSLHDLNELYELRDAIESCAAGLAAESITTDELEELEFIVAAQADLVSELSGNEDSTSNPRSATKSQMAKWVALEEQFHEEVIRCARNRLLAKVIRDQRTIGRIFESHLDHGDLLTAESANNTVKGKRELLAVFRARDSERARQIMSQQIRTGRRHVIELLRKKGIR